MTHACAAYGCGTMISDLLDVCLDHWAQLPEGKRQALTITRFAPGDPDSVEHLCAVARAADWLKANTPQQEGSTSVNR